MYESEYRTQRTIRESISVADGLVKGALVKGQETGSATIARLVTFISVVNRKGERRVYLAARIETRSRTHKYDFSR